jgi:hypothetical protein
MFQEAGSALGLVRSRRRAPRRRKRRDFLMVAAVHLPRGMSRAGGDDDGEDEEGSEGQVSLLPSADVPQFRETCQT